MMTLGPSFLSLLLRLDVVISITVVVTVLPYCRIAVLVVSGFRINQIDAYAGATTGTIVTHLSRQM